MQVATAAFTFDLQRFDGNFKVGENTYSTLQEAVTAVDANGTIELTAEASAGLTDDSQTGITLDKNITLKLNGFKLTCEAQVLFDIKKDAKLTINEASGTGSDGGTIVATKGSGYTTGTVSGVHRRTALIILDAGASLDVNNATFDDQSNSTYAEGSKEPGSTFFYLRRQENVTPSDTYQDWVATDYGEINLNYFTAERLC